MISCSETQKNRLPNIVLIFMDDLGYGDIANFGAINYRTPNIDRMVNEGMLFTNFYSAQAVCSASRAGLLTGTYPNRIGISGALMPYSDHGLHSDEITIAEMLKEKGTEPEFLGSGIWDITISFYQIIMDSTPTSVSHTLMICGL